MDKIKFIVFLIVGKFMFHNYNVKRINKRKLTMTFIFELLN